MMSKICRRGIRESGTVSCFCLMAVLVWLVLPAGAAWAQMGPDYWQVTGVASDDNLNIRTGPGAKNPIVGIAPNGFIFRNLGCRGEGNSRWCHVETPDGLNDGWVSGRYLRESGAPGAGSGKDVPELHARNTGEIEIRFRSGCTVLYNPAGRRINAGSSCSRAQLGRAHDAVEGFLREQGMTPGAESVGASGADVDMRGNGTVIGGGRLDGRIFGHKEGRYAVMISGAADDLTCTGLLRHDPGAVKSESASLHCTNGASGNAVIATNRNGRGYTMSFSLNDGSGGYVLF